MDCSTHTHQKWDCPKSNGRHEWFIQWNAIPRQLKVLDGKVGLPVRCAHECGAFGTEWYIFSETIEGE